MQKYQVLSGSWLKVIAMAAMELVSLSVDIPLAWLQVLPCLRCTTANVDLLMGQSANMRSMPFTLYTCLSCISFNPFYSHNISSSFIS